jgi:hypothetical protein
VLELRLDPERAERHRLFDPVTIAVIDRTALGATSQRISRHQDGADGKTGAHATAFQDRGPASATSRK